MSAVDYSPIAAKALAGIQKAGKSVSISRETGGTEDAFTGIATGSTTVSGTLSVLELKSLRGIATESFLNQYAEDRVKGKVRYLLAAASGASFEPEVDDELTMDSLKWETLFCSPFRPAETSILYYMGVRRK